MKYLYILVIFLLFTNCTVKKNIYTVISVTETDNNQCKYVVDAGELSMFIWNSPMRYEFVDDCGKYKINETVFCETLSNDYNLDACRN